jgi:hypothetical protein
MKRSTHSIATCYYRVKVMWWLRFLFGFGDKVNKLSKSVLLRIVIKRGGKRTDTFCRTMMWNVSAGFAPLRIICLRPRRDSTRCSVMRSEDTIQQHTRYVSWWNLFVITDNTRTFALLYIWILLPTWMGTFRVTCVPYTCPFISCPWREVVQTQDRDSPIPCFFKVCPAIDQSELSDILPTGL